MKDDLCPFCGFAYYESDTSGEPCGECKKELDRQYWESPSGQEEILERLREED
jgi:hypothetical protein